MPRKSKNDLRHKIYRSHKINNTVSQAALFDNTCVQKKPTENMNNELIPDTTL